MILLLGGTSDTAFVAQRLAEAGLSVLVSTATNEDLAIGVHPAIRRRTGRLDEPGLEDLIRRESIAAVVDVTHPYATEIRNLGQEAAASNSIPYATFVRPAAIDETLDTIQFAATHDEAARLAFSHGRCVLLTTGATNLAAYAKEARRVALPLFVRVLPRAESLAQCADAEIGSERVLAARGPFDIQQNRVHIRRCHAGVLVTKDGGHASGVIDKLQAARLEGCEVIVVRRPILTRGQAFDDPNALVRHVLQVFLYPDESNDEEI